MSDSKVDKAAERWFLANEQALEYQARLSALYHGKRERFLDICARLCQAGTALMATAAFANVASGGSFQSWTSLLAAFLSIIPLVFGFSQRAKDHAQLAADHRRLLAEILTAGVRLSESDFLRFRGRAAQIAASEKTPLGALVVQCQNELAVAKDQGESVVHIGHWTRIWMHFYNFDTATIKEKSDAKKARLSGKPVQ